MERTIRRRRGLAVAFVFLLPACAQPLPQGMREETEDDIRITGCIQTSLTSEGLAPPLHRVTVTARDGVVTLRGKVKTRDARVRAATIAERTKGVSGVDNQLLYDRP